MSDKWCPKCQQDKELACFSKDKHTISGLSCWCKVCKKTQYSAWIVDNKEIAAKSSKAYAQRPDIKAKNKIRLQKWSVENRDKERARKKQWKNDNREECLKRAKQYRLENTAAMREYFAEYRRKNLEARKTYEKSFREANRELVKSWSNTARAKRKNVQGRHTGKEIKDLFERQRGLCANPFCCVPLTLKNRHLDHKDPISLGGTNDIGNLQWLCAPCNLQKSAKTNEEWLALRAYRGF